MIEGGYDWFRSAKEAAEAAAAIANGTRDLDHQFGILRRPFSAEIAETSPFLLGGVEWSWREEERRRKKAEEAEAAVLEEEERREERAYKEANAIGDY